MRRALTVAAALVVTSASAFAQAAGDAAAGGDVYKKCRACHQVGADAKNGVGPTLNGLFGRKSGTIEGFAYSDANKEAGAKGLVWTEEAFDKYITDPRAFMPGNKMAFVGVKDPQDRADLIAFLKAQK